MRCSQRVWHHAAALLFWTFVAFLATGSTTALAVECERVASAVQTVDPWSGDDQGGTGAGGTGLFDPNGSGTGGTGIYAHQGSGTGGTGLALPEDEGGIAGSGVFGTVMAFGSVCVNGMKVEYDASTPVESNGRPARAEDLELGQVIRIETRSDDPNRARRIAIESPLRGPVDRVDPERSRVFIMGSEVQLRPDAVVHGTRSGARSLDEIEVGTTFEVSGLYRSDGVIVASRLDEREADVPALITGIATPSQTETFNVGRVRTRLAPGSSVGADRRRARVQVRGRWNSRTQLLEEATVREAPTHLDGPREVSLQGYVARDLGDGDFRIAGTLTSVSDSSGQAQPLHLDALVRVQGRLDEDGRLRASRIVVEERGRTQVVVGAAPVAAISPETKGAEIQSALENLADQIEEQLEQIDFGKLNANLEAARVEAQEQIERIDQDGIEERVERIERDAIDERAEKVERIDKPERIEKVERDERVEKEARDEIGDRIDRYR